MLFDLSEPFGAMSNVQIIIFKKIKNKKKLKDGFVPFIKEW